jgi:hypothetical protein
MINIFKKAKPQKPNGSGAARTGEEPTFSKVFKSNTDDNAVDDVEEIPAALRLTKIDSELMEPVLSDARASRKGRPAAKPASGNGLSVEPAHSPIHKPAHSPAHSPVRSPAHNPTHKKDIEHRQAHPSPRSAEPVPAAEPARRAGSPRRVSMQSAAHDELPSFKAPPLDPSARPARPAGDIEGDSQAKLWEAFTPTKPKRWSRYFAGRRWAIQRVITAIEEEQAHVVIFGARGIGKTSLANVLAESASQVEYQVLRCPCSADITFEEIFRGFLRNLPSEFMDRSARAKNPAVEHFEQLLPRGSFGPTELTVALNYLKLEHVILIIDEFDRITSEQLKNQLAETIKNLSDISARITFIVVGIAQNLDELIGKHQSIQRHLVAVHLPLMEAPELRALIEVGEEASGMAFEEATRESIVSFAKGLPYYAQLMCLYSGRHALERGSHTVEMTDLREAMTKVLNEADPVTVAMYDMATQGERNQFMTDVMFTAARCRFDRFGAFTAADAADVSLDGDDRKLRELTLHKALSTLNLPQNGAVLEKMRTPSGTMKYSFQHQTMRQYILVRQARQRGLI